MIHQDDRTPEQTKTHTLPVVATDRFLSGWGPCRNGKSKCGWAFDPSKVSSDRVFEWVKARSEMRYVNLVDLRTYRPRNCARFHLYVADENHPAAKF